MSDQVNEHRKLAAIMFTDMVGYSALAQKDERLAVVLLEEQRRVVRSVLPDFEGREIETAGDSFLVDFASAVQATRCAIEIQRTLHDRNTKETPERQILLRIGLHVGDVIVTEQHVVGDGVNVAARMEPLAVPGGICLSEDVMRHIRNKIDFPLRQLPTRALKNILYPVSIYALDLPWLTQRMPPGPGGHDLAVHDDEIIGQTISHYKILQELGKGGMGVVYKAEDVGLHRTVALKLLPQGQLSDPESKARFAREAQAAARLQHPNIATVYEFDEAATGQHELRQSFIAMEYIEGISLKEKLSQGALSIDESVNTVMQLARGLQSAHKHGVVHRDLKPANIMIDTQGVVKILDFGVAHLVDATGLTDRSKIVGSIPYMSPEQIQGLPVDHRSDLFSFGVLLFEMVTGTRPFVSEHEAALFYSIVNMDPTPPSVLRPEIPLALEKIILRLMQKDTSKRFQTADEVLDDLSALALSPNRPSGPMTGIAHELKKRRLVVPAFLVLLVMSVALWFPFHSTRQPVIRLEGSRYVLVADFENRTEYRFFDHSLTEAMKVALRQSPRMNLFPSYRIPEALQTMGLPPDHRLDERTALQLAQRQGAQMLVAGSVSLIGRSYMLTCKIIDAVSGEPLDLLHRQTLEVENVLSEMDELSRGVRERIGESTEEILDYSMPLEKVTTPSLEALELYSRGDLLEGQGKYQEAALLKEQAVAIDSLFTFAVSDLSYIHRKLGNDSIALGYHRRVLPLLSRVTDRERFAILTTYYGPSFEFNAEKALQSGQQLALRYPNSAEAQGQLGYLAMYFCDPATAMEAIGKTLALDSAYAGVIFNNAGYAAALSGDVESAISFFRKSKTLRPTYYTIDGYIAHAQWVGGELDSAEQTLRAILPVGDMRRKLLSRAQLAALYFSRGQFSQAKRECDSSTSVFRQERIAVSEAFFHQLLGEIAFETGKKGLYEQEMRLAEAIAQSPYTDLAMVAVSYARRAYFQDAVRVLRHLRQVNSLDPYYVRRRDDFERWIHGEMFLAQGSTRKASQEFEKVEKIHCGDPIYFSTQRGLAFCAASLSDSLGILRFQRLLDHSGELVMGPMLSYPSTGSWTSYIIPESHLELGKLYLRGNKRAEALHHLEAGLRYWRNADSAFKNAKELKEIMLKLQQ